MCTCFPNTHPMHCTSTATSHFTTTILYVCINRLHVWHVAYECMCLHLKFAHERNSICIHSPSVGSVQFIMYSSVQCVPACESVLCVCAFRAISKEANSLVDRNCNGLKVEPLAPVMQVEPHKPHQSQQRYNEAEPLNTATPATMRLLLPRQQQTQLGWQHAEGQPGSFG